MAANMKAVTVSLSLSKAMNVEDDGYVQRSALEFGIFYLGISFF
jgi:hypothetical protein